MRVATSTGFHEARPVADEAKAHRQRGHDRLQLDGTVATGHRLAHRRPELATSLTQMTLWWIERYGLSGIHTDTYSYSDREFLARWSVSCCVTSTGFAKNLRNEASECAASLFADRCQRI